MFRLVKVLNGNNQCDIFKIKSSVTASIIPGCALVCSNGALANATATVCPDYVALGKDTKEKGIIDAMAVTEDMIFKVEYTGTTAPLVGMTVYTIQKTQTRLRFAASAFGIGSYQCLFGIMSS